METKEIFDNRYVVYSDGKVWSNKYKKYLTPFINNKGYTFFTFCVNGVPFKKLLHRIVAESFIPNPDNLPEVNHIDRDKSNNSINNLEWITKRDNHLHIFKSKYPGSCFNKAMNKWQSTIRINGKKKFLGYFDTQEEASNAYILYRITHNT